MRKFLTVTCCALLVLANINAAVYYVSPSGNDANSGSSWENSVKDIQAAMSKAVNGDEIWVKAGEYTLTAHYIPGQTSGAEAGVWLKDGVSIYAGFSGIETSVDQRARTNATEEPWSFTNQTIVLGGLKKDGVTPLRLFDRADKNMLYTTAAYIDGFTFRDWDAKGSRLLYLKENQIVRNSAFINCSDNSSVLYFEDGGKVANTLFDNCKKPLYVRAVAGTAPNTEVRQTIDVENCTFKNNSTVPLSIYSTGAPESDSPSVIVKGSKFISNTHELSSPYVASNYYSSGISINHAPKKRCVDIHDNIFENNVNKDNGASAAMITGAGKLNFYNNIIRNNRTEKAPEVTGQAATLVLYQAPDDGNIFNNLIVNNESNGSVIYAVQPIFFNNTVANNNGKMYFVNASVLFNNIFSKNIVDDVDVPVHLDAGVFAMYMYNANTVSVTLAPSGDDFVEENVLLTNGAGFVSPTSFVGQGNIGDIRAANFGLATESQALSVGSLSLLGDDGLAYPQTWFDFYFAKDLAGNDRTNSSLIDAGAYQKQTENSVNSIVKDNIIKWAAGNGRVTFQTEKYGNLVIHNSLGKMVYNVQLNPGVSSVDKLNKGVYIVKFTSGVYVQSFKVIIK